jgi:hypothetical protein
MIPIVSLLSKFQEWTEDIEGHYHYAGTFPRYSFKGTWPRKMCVKNNHMRQRMPYIGLKHEPPISLKKFLITPFKSCDASTIRLMPVQFAKMQLANTQLANRQLANRQLAKKQFANMTIR